MGWHARTPDEIRQLGFYQRTDPDVYDNCVEIYSYLNSLGWTLNAICGMIGNIEHESVYNPFSWENNIALASTETERIDTSAVNGYGLTGFTPSGKYLHYPSSMASPFYAPYFSDIPQRANPNDGYAQLDRINVGDSDVYVVREPVTFSEYIHSTNSVDNLTYVWMRNHENPASYSTLPQRQEAARYWYQILGGITPPPPPQEFVPRTTDEGMRGSPWWYSNGNVFYAAGYGLPNCTCYAYGRYAEIQNNQYVFPQLPTGDAGTWYANATAFNRGSTPALGAVICFGDSPLGKPGHVAIVEAIYPDGSIMVSHSGYNSFYFRTDTLTPANNYCDGWIGSSAYQYRLQGFIYNQFTPIPPTPPTPQPTRKKGMPLWMRLRYLP